VLVCLCLTGGALMPMVLSAARQCEVVFSFTFFSAGHITIVFSILSLHDALPILLLGVGLDGGSRPPVGVPLPQDGVHRAAAGERSEEHTSELQSRVDLVCRLLLEKKTRAR